METFTIKTVVQKPYIEIQFDICPEKFSKVILGVKKIATEKGIGYNKQTVSFIRTDIGLVNRLVILDSRLIHVLSGKYNINIKDEGLHLVSNEEK